MDPLLYNLFYRVANTNPRSLNSYISLRFLATLGKCSPCLSRQLGRRYNVYYKIETLNYNKNYDDLHYCARIKKYIVIISFASLSRFSDPTCIGSSNKQNSIILNLKTVEDNNELRQDKFVLNIFCSGVFQILCWKKVLHFGKSVSNDINQLWIW